MNGYQIVKALLVALVSIFGPGLVICSAESIKLGKFKGKEYFYDTGAYTSIDQARNAAFKAGRVLASIGSAEENNFLISKITPPKELVPKGIGAYQLLKLRITIT